MKTLHTTLNTIHLTLPFVPCSQLLTGLVPFKPERVILSLNVQLRTPSPPLPNNKP